jgi:hypothetical protein
VEDRLVVNGLAYKIRTGISWRDLPDRYGPWKTVYTRFRRYALDGVFTGPCSRSRPGLKRPEDGGSGSMHHPGKLSAWARRVGHGGGAGDVGDGVVDLVTALVTTVGTGWLVVARLEAAGAGSGSPPGPGQVPDVDAQDRLGGGPAPGGAGAGRR